MLITSLQNERVKLAHLLQTKARARRKEGKIVLEGLRLVRDAIMGGHQPEFVLYTPDAVEETLIAQLEASRAALLPVSPQVMAHVSDTQTPQGVLAVFPMPAYALPEKLTRVLILDAVRDPGNMGTLLRTGAAAGVQAVLLAPESADPYNPKTLRAGMGAHFRVPIVEADWASINQVCGALNVYAAAYPGDLRYDQADWRAAWALIIGSEAHGVGADALRLAAGRLVYIPMAAATESLNAAQAGAVILFEAARQRQFTTGS